MQKYQIFKGNKDNLNYKCIAYKKVKISNKEYTVTITDVHIENSFDRFYDIDVCYNCNMFDENDNIIYDEIIKRNEDKKYLSVINEFCTKYIRHKLLCDKNFYEEQRRLKALQRLEQWDGIFSVDDVLDTKI